MSNSEKHSLGLPTTNAENTARHGAKRLDSWKEIAAFLNRSIRTAQRWERQEDMPVHRHVHLCGESVFAFCDEVTQWLTNRSRTRPASRLTVTENRVLVGSLRFADQTVLRTLLRTILEQLEREPSTPIVPIDGANNPDERTEQREKVNLNDARLLDENRDGSHPQTRTFLPDLQ